MNPTINLINARIPNYENLQQIRINQGFIEEIAYRKNELQINKNEEVLDINGDWISLGGVDLQINGALGLAFPDLEAKHLPLLKKICEFLWEQGIDAFLPTIVTTSTAKIKRSLATIGNFMKTQLSAKEAKVVGVHLEGPFLNYEKRGAHPAEYLLPLIKENIKEVLGDYTSVVKVITLAPELDIRGEVISYLHSRRIIISLGHSQATAEEAQKAFKIGASMVTHAFNAMPGLHHRQPGLLGEAIINKNVYCGLIADGQHVCPTMIKLLLEASHYDQGIFLVSDALAPLGLPDGVYPWDDRQIDVKNGTAKLTDGTLAGTTLPLLVGVENLVKWGICEVVQAIAMATESPRKAMGLPGIAVGQPAQLLRWHWDQKNSKLTWQRVEL